MTSKLVLTFVVALALAGCPGVGWLPRLVQGAGWLGSVLDVASDAAEVYSGRHPQRERDEAIAQALRLARGALAAVHEAATAGDRPTVDAAVAAALAAYRELRALLEREGVLDGRAPAGGAEVDGAPLPEPVRLPEPDDVARAMSP